MQYGISKQKTKYLRPAVKQICNNPTSDTFRCCIA